MATSSRLIVWAFVCALAMLGSGIAAADDASKDLPVPPGGWLNDDAPVVPEPPAPPDFPAARDEPPPGDSPPPPPPPEGEQPMEPVEGDQPPAEDDPCDFPPPAPRPCDIRLPIFCPPPCDEPRLERPPAACCFPRDECGWAIDSCGRRLGCTEIVFEGLYTIFEDMTGLVGEPVVGAAYSWDPNSYDGEFGGRVTLRRVLTPRDKIEGRGAWYGQYDTTTSQFGSLGFSPPAGSQTLPQTGTLNTESELWSVEANWWREICCTGRWRWSTVLGLRYIYLEEEASLVSVNVAAPGGPPALASVLSQTDTDFIAGQIGGSGTFLLTNQIEAGLSVKALLGSMRRSVDISDTSIFAGGPHAAASEKRVFGFGGEVEVSLLHRLTRNIAATAGYSLLFLNDVVRADDAMDFTQAASGAVQARQKTDNMLNHSFFVGVQLNL